MLTQRQGFAVNVLQGNDCRDRPVALGQEDGLMAKIGDVVREWATRRRHLQPFHSRISLPPIVSTLRRFRPTARTRTTPVADPTTSQKTRSCPRVAPTVPSGSGL